MPGYPVCAWASVRFGRDSATGFRWLLRRNATKDNPLEERLLGDGPEYVPTREELCGELWVEVTASDGFREGGSTRVAVGRVEEGPEEVAGTGRHSLTRERAAAPVMRVMTYNILADQYASTDYAKDVLFSYCTPHALEVRQDGRGIGLLCPPCSRGEAGACADGLTQATAGFGLFLPRIGTAFGLSDPVVVSPSHAAFRPSGPVVPSPIEPPSPLLPLLRRRPTAGSCSFGRSWASISTWLPSRSAMRRPSPSSQRSWVGMGCAATSSRRRALCRRGAPCFGWTTGGRLAKPETSVSSEQ